MSMFLLNVASCRREETRGRTFGQRAEGVAVRRVRVVRGRPAILEVAATSPIAWSTSGRVSSVSSMYALIVKPVLKRRGVFVAVALNICNPSIRPPAPSDLTAGAYSQPLRTRHSPFALPVHLVLREGNVLVLNADPKVRRDFPQVLISRPL